MSKNNDKNNQDFKSNSHQTNLKEDISKKVNRSIKTRRDLSLNNQGYCSKYIQSKAIAEIKSKTKMNTRYSRDTDKQFQNNLRAKSLLNKQNSKSMNNA